MDTSDRSMLNDALTLTGLCKQFAGVTVLDHVDLTVRGGEVHALLGANGAGKSTLIKILAGVYKRDGGHIAFRGEPAEASEHLPIAFIHQDLGLAPSLTVAENIALVVGYPTRLGRIGWKEVNRRATQILADMGADVDPGATCATLGAAERAIVAIARAVSLDRPVMVLDEPTAALPEPEVARLLEVIRRVKRSGVGIIYVTHRLDEVFRIADRVTVLRDGRRVATADITEVTKDDLIQQITGQLLTTYEPAQRQNDARPLLSVRDVVAAHAGPVSFHLYPGEIVGLIGLRGAGQSSIARAVYGAIERAGGHVKVNDTTLPPNDVPRSIQSGLGFVSSNRAEESMASMLTVRENLFPSRLLRGDTSHRFAIPRKERDFALDALRRFSVRPLAPNRLIDNLSGGNQQKVVLARWMTFPGRVLILDEPTFGVDVGSRADIYAALNDAARRGRAILLVSSDMDEVASVCHRALVVRDGRIAAEVGQGDLSPHRLTALSSGSPI